MRRGYKMIRVRADAAARTGVDQTPEEFAETMGYAQRRFKTRDAFLQNFQADWILELHAALQDLLEKNRDVLGIGSGECEHELPFFLEGYSISGSDVTPQAFAETHALFPEFPARVFDIFNPDCSTRYDDVLITGLDSYFEDAKAEAIFRNVRGLLKPGGRLLFTLRYNDNLGTWLIDYLGIPLLTCLRNTQHLACQTDCEFKLKMHGYRRTRKEIIAMAHRVGFRLGRIRHAGYGGEFIRVGLPRFPLVYQSLRRLDHRLHWFNIATVFEFMT